jgi:hypothetical protein
MFGRQALSFLLAHSTLLNFHIFLLLELTPALRQISPKFLRNIYNSVPIYLGSGMVGTDISINELRLKRARGAILEYIRGLKQRADIKWVLGVLKGSFGVSKDEALALIQSVKNDKSLILTPDRLDRLELLRRKVEAEEW